MNNLTLKQEVKMLRSAVIGLIGRDKEGHYRPEFVKEMFDNLKRKPTHTFTDSNEFRKQVKLVK